MKKKAMDEKSVILHAIKSTPQVDTDTEPDAIEKWAARKKKQESFRNKPCKEWSMLDFSRYLDFMLKEFGVFRSKNVARDCDYLNTLHDRLAKKLKSKMNNLVLRDYLDWWCSIWAPRYTASEVYLTLLMNDQQINRFVSRYKEREDEIAVEIPTEVKDVSDVEIYNFGGLELLIMKKGIVVGNRVLRAKGVADAREELRKSLARFSKQALINTLNVTIQNAPYSRADQVDFISLSSPILLKHNMTDFLQLSAMDYFQE